MGPGRGFSIFELEYIGCYFARKVEEQTKADHVKKQIKLIQKKKGVRKIPVLLIVTAAGAKVTDKRGQVVLIANSHFQIKYCAYLREERIFCFLSRESSRYEEVHQYIHVFTTSRAEVDELNANICNAFEVAQVSNTGLPAKSAGSKKTNKISRSISLNAEASIPSPLSHTDSLSASFTATNNSSLASLACIENSTNQQSSHSQPTNGSTLHQLVTRSASSRMLKHSVSAQAKLEVGRTGKSSTSQKQQSYQNNINASKIASQPQHATIANNFNQPGDVEKRGAAKGSPSTHPDNRNSSVDFKYSNVTYKPPPSTSTRPTSPPRYSQVTSPATSSHLSGTSTISSDRLPSATSNIQPTRLSNNSSDVYAKVRKTPSPHPSPRTQSSPGKDSKSPVYRDNLAYLNEDYIQDAPPVPECIYERLPATGTGALTSKASASGAMSSSAVPPPIAFSDYDAEQRKDACKDYIDIDKASLNNNNSDTMSFYSDNYVRPGVLGIGKGSSSSHLRPHSLSSGIYSPGSSGLSICSIEGELMNGRPLPLTPESELRSNGAVTPLRYQNDSPFVSAARTLNRTQSPGSGKRSTTSSPSAQVNQTAAEKQRSAEELLKQVPWFKPKMSRELVLESLAREDLGSFIIRESSTHNTCFALSVKVPKFNNPTGIAHYIIHRTPSQGFKIKGLEKEWSNLSSLVIHHTIMPELLPCTLKIPHPVSSRHPSTTSRNSSSSRGSSNSASPTLNSSAASGSIDRLAIGLDKKLNVTHEGAV